MKNITNKQLGIALIEFALTLPVILIVTFLIVNAGALFYNQAVITNAAREGARWGSIHTSDCSNIPSPCTVASSYANNRLISFGATPTVLVASSESITLPSVVTVRVSYAYTGIGFATLDFVGIGTLGPSSTAIMYHE